MRKLGETLGLTRTTRFINVLEIGATRTPTTTSREARLEIALEMPLFDWGGAQWPGPKPSTCRR